jgi:hypothetical protein
VYHQKHLFGDFKKNILTRGKGGWEEKKLRDVVALL